MNKFISCDFLSQNRAILLSFCNLSIKYYGSVFFIFRIAPIWCVSESF